MTQIEGAQDGQGLLRHEREYLRLLSTMQRDKNHQTTRPSANAVVQGIKKDLLVENERHTRRVIHDLTNTTESIHTRMPQMKLVGQAENEPTMNRKGLEIQAAGRVTVIVPKSMNMVAPLGTTSHAQNHFHTRDVRRLRGMIVTFAVNDDRHPRPHVRGV